MPLQQVHSQSADFKQLFSSFISFFLLYLLIVWVHSLFSTVLRSSFILEFFISLEKPTNSMSPMSPGTVFPWSLHVPPGPCLRITPVLSWLHALREMIHSFLPCHHESLWSYSSICSPHHLKILHLDKPISGTSNFLP